MQSIWQETRTAKRRYEPLVGHRHTDVLVIGGGMAGVLTAYFLGRSGVDCLLVEAGELGGGATGNTTAKITAQHGLCYADLIDKLGTERAAQYYAANRDAIAAYRRLAERFPCDLQTVSSYVYARDDRARLERECEAYRRLGIPGYFTERLPLPFATVGAAAFDDQAQFHPLKLLDALAAECEVCERSPVREIRGRTAYCEQGTVSAEKIVIATRYPLVNVPGFYFVKLYQERSYVLALQGAPDYGGVYLDAAETGFSFRNYDGCLLVGGGGHRTGKKGGCWRPLRDFAARYYPRAAIGAVWAAQDCISLDRVPYVGIHRRSAPGVYVATGFNKWGMTGSMVAAVVLCDLVRGVRNPCAALLAPGRPPALGQLTANLASSAAGLVRFGKRCSHLGCALRWNAEESSWDCSCHGSRFDGQGKVLDNPAKEQIKP